MNPNEMWQAEVNGQIYDAEFSELAAWVGENALLPDDKVRRGNLRWLEAGKVPSLMPFFNAKEIGIAPPEMSVSAVDGENADAVVQIQTANFAPELVESQSFENDRQIKIPCALHAESEAEFTCQTCFNNFCRECPQYAESLGKLCPICGALVRSIAEEKQFNQTHDFPVPNEDFSNRQQQFQIQTKSAGNFGFADFGRALAHPFKYKLSLVFGALMYMFFTLGQQAYALGGIFMIFASVVAFMLANMLTFGVLANVVENFASRKFDTNFMPDFDGFSLWDDVIHPFFLSIGAYITSFALFFVIVIIGGWYMVGAVQSEMLGVQTNAATVLMPGINQELENASKIPDLQKAVENVKQQVEQRQNGIPNPAYNEEQNARNVEQMIADSRRAQLESMTATPPETQSARMTEIGRRLLKKSLPLVILAGLAFLYGLFYFPAACAVAGYTRSFSATLNPKIGWNTIKNLGSDYAQILLMTLIIGAAAFVIALTLNLALSAFAIPQIGNLPAIAVMSWATFYLWIVFSCVLGYAIGKKSDKLGIYRG